MKPQQTIPLLSTLGPAALAVSPVAVVGVLIGAGLLWLLFEQDKAKREVPEPENVSPIPEEIPAETPRALLPEPATPAKRVTREDLAEALEYGARRITRKEAVESLQTLGFRKTAAYKALSPVSKFSNLIKFTPDGLIEWKG